MANERRAEHVNFDDWARDYRTAVAGYRETHVPDDYAAAENERVRLQVRYVNRSVEISGMLDGHPDRATLETILDDLATRIRLLEQPLER